jgi:diguanylate cyclase (GGDEF)-like protein
MSGNRALGLVVGTMIATALAALVVLVRTSHDQLDITVPLVLLAAFTLIGELYPIRFAGHDGELTIASSFLLAMLLIAGPLPVVIVQIAATTTAELVRRKPLQRLTYNAAMLVVCWTATGALWEALRRHPGDPLARGNAGAALAATLLFFLLNLTLARLPVAVQHGRSFLSTLLANLAFEAWTTLILFSLSPIVVAVALEHPLLLPILGVPAIAIHRGGRDAVVNEFLATHDRLTGLPNRALLDERLQRALQGGGGVAVLVMNLDHFTDVNDTLGHPCGDELLQALALRLQHAVPAGATVARTGGDEFAVAVPLGGGPAELARTLLAALDDPFEIGTLNLRIGASIGIACAPAHGDNAGLLLQRADIALQTAKAQRRPWVVYADDQDHHSPLRLQLASELRDALANEQLELHYQPLITLADGRLDRVEALMRWRHPERGLVPPDQFVPLAERTGLIRELTSFALGEALAQLARWREQGLSTRVAVNLSVHNLVETLPGEIAALLALNGLEPDVLELELTESMIMAEPERAASVLGELRAMGLELAVDDFGTGYSSLSYLRQLPVTSLKIDRSFVTDTTIVSAIVELAHALGLKITAEGVEEAETRDRLRELGCQRAQGYLFSRPLPPADLLAWADELLASPAWES